MRDQLTRRTFVTTTGANVAARAMRQPQSASALPATAAGTNPAP